MSVRGHQRRFEGESVMSVVHRISDIRHRNGDGRKGPLPDSCSPAKNQSFVDWRLGSVNARRGAAGRVRYLRRTVTH
jgi:hypothetical protein